MSRGLRVGGLAVVVREPNQHSMMLGAIVEIVELHTGGILFLRYGVGLEAPAAKIRSSRGHTDIYGESTREGWIATSCLRPIEPDEADQSVETEREEALTQ